MIPAPVLGRQIEVGKVEIIDGHAYGHRVMSPAMLNKLAAWARNEGYANAGAIVEGWLLGKAPATIDAKKLREELEKLSQVREGKPGAYAEAIAFCVAAKR